MNLVFGWFSLSSSILIPFWSSSIVSSQAVSLMVTVDFIRGLHCSVPFCVVFQAFYCQISSSFHAFFFSTKHTFYLIELLSILWFLAFGCTFFFFFGLLLIASRCHHQYLKIRGEEKKTNKQKHKIKLKEEQNVIRYVYRFILFLLVAFLGFIATFFIVFCCWCISVIHLDRKAKRTGIFGVSSFCSY